MDCGCFEAACGWGFSSSSVGPARLCNQRAVYVSDLTHQGSRQGWQKKKGQFLVGESMVFLRSNVSCWKMQLRTDTHISVSVWLCKVLFVSRDKDLLGCWRGQSRLKWPRFVSECFYLNANSSCSFNWAVQIKAQKPTHQWQGATPLLPLQVLGSNLAPGNRSRVVELCLRQPGVTGGSFSGLCVSSLQQRHRVTYAKAGLGGALLQCLERTQ